jgi:hypothetical protein
MILSEKEKRAFKVSLYLSGLMVTEEASAFESELSSNAEIRKELEFQQSFDLEGIDDDVSIEVKKGKGLSIKHLLIIGGTLLSLVILNYNLNYFGSSEEEDPKEDIDELSEPEDSTEVYAAEYDKASKSGEIGAPIGNAISLPQTSIGEERNSPGQGPADLLRERLIQQKREAFLRKIKEYEELNKQLEEDRSRLIDSISGLKESLDSISKLDANRPQMIDSINEGKERNQRINRLQVLGELDRTPIKIRIEVLDTIRTLIKTYKVYDGRKKYSKEHLNKSLEKIGAAAFYLIRIENLISYLETRKNISSEPYEYLNLNELLYPGKITEFNFLEKLDMPLPRSSALSKKEFINYFSSFYKNSSTTQRVQSFNRLDMSSKIFMRETSNYYNKYILGSQ